MRKQYHLWEETRAQKFSPAQLAQIDREIAHELLEMAEPPPVTRPRRGWVKAINGGVPLPLPKREGEPT